MKRNLTTPVEVASQSDVPILILLFFIQIFCCAFLSRLLGDNHLHFIVEFLKRLFYHGMV